MRLGVVAALAAAVLLWPALLFAQSGDAGPDAGMNAINREAAHGTPPKLEPPPAATSEDAHAESDCDKSDDKGADARADKARCRKLTDADIATAPINEVRQVTHHTATIGGKPVAYTATAGTLTLRDDEGKPIASMFYVAYTTGDPRRPVTFFYNGGPGSSTLWLHMGSLGPVRVLTDSPQATHNAPYEVANNDSSLLDKSDLVFVDAIGAGYSRPLATPSCRHSGAPIRTSTPSPVASSAG